MTSGGVWKPVLGFEDRYEVSSHGKVRSVPFEKHGKNMHGEFSFTTKRLILKTYVNQGYEVVCLTDSATGKQHYKRVHRLVAEAFIPNPENKSQVNHKDGDKTNNCVENLEWNTASENVRHAFMSGLTSNAGERHPRTKLSNSQIAEIRELRKSGVLLRDIGELYSVHLSTISKICTGVHFKCVP